MNRLFTLLALAAVTLSANAQSKPEKRSRNLPKTNIVSPASNYYSFSTFTAPYSSFVGTSITSGKKWDEPIDTIPIGFNFKLYDNQNDSIQLVGGAYFTYDDVINGNSLSAGAAMFEDLCDKAFNPNTDSEGDPGGISNISYTTTGVAGSRIFKIQVKNAGFYGENNNAMDSISSVSFQMWLYETSNNIEFRYDSINIQNPTDNLINAGGFVTGLMDSLDFNTSLAVRANMLNGVHTSPVMVGPNASFSDFITGNIQRGRVYKFTRAGVISGINSVSKIKGLQLFPNPAKDKLFIKNTSSELENATVEFYEVTGKLIYSEKMKSEIDLSAFNKGLYILKIKAEGKEVFIDKLIVAE